MSRTQSQGLEYFYLAVDFFSDKKIKILKARYGADGITIYLYLLCMVYREGWYTPADKDLIYIISDELNMSSDKVQQVLAFLFERSMFDEQLFKSDAVLTSTGIQERWQKAVSARAKKTPIEVGKYWLLKESETEPYIHCTLFNNSSEKKDDNSEKKDDNSENYSQSKVKESKVNNTHTQRTRENISEGEDKLQDLHSQKKFSDDYTNFVKRWNIKQDSNSPFLVDFDYAKLNKAYEESSKWLQCTDVCLFLSWIVKNYTSIIEGKYKDRPPKQKEKPKKKFHSSYDPFAIPWEGDGGMHITRCGEGGDDDV